MVNILQRYGWLSYIVILAIWLPTNAIAHGIDDDTRRFLVHNSGVQITPFLYIGAKHMITG